MFIVNITQIGAVHEKSDQQFLDLTIVAKTDLTDNGFKNSFRQIFTTTKTEMIKRKKKLFINEDGKTPKDVFSKQKIITASLKSERFHKKQIKIYIILSYIYQLLYYIKLSYIYQLLVNS